MVALSLKPGEYGLQFVKIAVDGKFTLAWP